jgi:HSP20 family protein
MATERTTQNAPLEQSGKQEVQRERTRPGLTFRPDVDIAESREAFLVTADLPGVDESHVDVRLEDGVLSIDAELAVLPDPSWRPVYAEYRLGGYHREFTIPDAVDATGIRATMRDGVLELHLPKVEAHRPRQIEVRGG